ncbi:MAG: HEAT repeat domain-containing protein [Planctomycetota bacterium]
MIDQLTEAILLAMNDRGQLARVAALSKSIQAMSDSETDDLLDRILDFGDELQRLGHLDPDSPPDPLHVRIDQILQPVVDHLCRRENSLEGSSWTAERIRNVESLYHFTPENSDLRNHLLRWLASSGNESAIEIWTELICNSPPEHRLGIVLAFAPLLQPDFDPPEWMLTRLINEATEHSQISAAIFDMFNFYFRNGKVTRHPALARVDELTDLLGQLTGQMGRIEEGNFPADHNARMINQLVSDSVALIVALCDTFAQINHEPAIGKLHQALELRHRRVQTEAAAALARMNVDTGKEILIQLAQQPIARLRVLAYAEELGFTNDISLELQGEIALAESHLAIWLAEPEQMGLAPSHIEFLDNREMYWPSYEHPVQCYLFRYEYGSGEQTHSNIGICGPLTHAFAADLQHLEIEDIYAAFAGWQTIHNEIYLIPTSKAELAFPNEWRHLKSQLEVEGFDELEFHSAASFFGEIVVIASAKHDGQPGTAIADYQQTTWLSSGNPAAPIDWQLAYTIWRGQQLLSSFNESESS